MTRQLAIVASLFTLALAQTGTNLYERDIARRRDVRVRPRAQISPVPPPPSGSGVFVVAVPDSDYYTCKPGDGRYVYSETYFQIIPGDNTGLYLNCYYYNPMVFNDSIYCVYDGNGKLRRSSSSSSGCPDNGGDLTPAAPYGRACYTVCSGPSSFFSAAIDLDPSSTPEATLGCALPGSRGICTFDANTGNFLSSQSSTSGVCADVVASKGNCVQ